MIAEILKGAVIESITDFFHESIVEIQVMLYRKSACKAFAALEQMSDI